MVIINNIWLFIFSSARFKFKTKGILKNARDAVRKKRLDAGELEWKMQIAACTIQLAWRKYARRQLMKRINNTTNITLHMWDAEMLAMKQKYNLHRIYGKKLYLINLVNIIVYPLFQLTKIIFPLWFFCWQLFFHLMAIKYKIWLKPFLLEVFLRIAAINPHELYGFWELCMN